MCVERIVFPLIWVAQEVSQKKLSSFYFKFYFLL